MLIKLTVAVYEILKYLLNIVKIGIYILFQAHIHQFVCVNARIIAIRKATDIKYSIHITIYLELAKFISKFGGQAHWPGKSVICDYWAKY